MDVVLNRYGDDLGFELVDSGIKFRISVNTIYDYLTGGFPSERQLRELYEAEAVS